MDHPGHRRLVLAMRLELAQVPSALRLLLFDLEDILVSFDSMRDLVLLVLLQRLLKPRVDAELDGVSHCLRPQELLLEDVLLLHDVVV